MKQISKLAIRNAFNKIRYDAHEDLMSDVFRYISINKVQGDYYEFGSYRGKSLITAYYFSFKNYVDINFHVYDSFEGLPHDEGIFEKGQYSCTKENYIKILKVNKIGLERVHITKGFYNETLSKELTGKASIIYVDCDLYSSTRLVLNSILGIIIKGTVIILEDYYNGDGARKAFMEWVNKYNIKYEIFSNKRGYYKAILIR